MEVFIQASLKIMKFGAWENIFGLMAKCTMASGKKIKCMDMEYWSGEMARDMRDNLLMTRERVEGYSNGKMEEFMMESGRMANNMEWGHLLLKIIK
jgi:hypothetical protein